VRSEQPVADDLPRDLVDLGLQYGRFVTVGVCATVAHVLTYAGVIELLGMQPLTANAIGFALAVNVSFVGHRHWTFRRGPELEASRSLRRFWIVAVFGFALNSLFVHLVTGTLGLAYGWAIPLIAGVTPMSTFLLSKLWAFRA
jgi:putative flippase GtrA